MALPDPAELAARFAVLPGAAPVLEAIRETTEDVYLAGGAVRDLWLGAGRPLDLDLVVVGDVRPLATRLGGGAVRAHERFGTATVEGDGGVRYDLAAARRESYPHPGALPEVRPAGIEQDLERRDFSVNALALGLSGADAGGLRSAPHGPEDLAQRRLRVLHAESFRDDPTRLLRLARYAGRLGFAIEAGTESLARAAVADGALGTVSGPRIGAELTLLAGERSPLPGFAVLRALGVDRAIDPGFGIEDPDAVRRGLELLALGGTGDSGRLVFAAVLLGVAQADRRGLLDRLGLDRQLRRVVLAAAAQAPELAARLPTEGPPSRMLGALPAGEPETIALAGGLADPAAARTLARWLPEIVRLRLEIDGSDLIAAGVAPGPRMALALQAARGAKLDGSAPTRESQLAAALRAAQAAG